METIVFVVVAFLAGIIMSLMVVQIPKAAFKQWDAEAKDFLNIKEEDSNEQTHTSVWGLETFKNEFSLKKQRHLSLGLVFLMTCLPVWLQVHDLLTLVLICGVIACILIAALVDWDVMYIPDGTIVLGLGLTFSVLMIQGDNLENHVIGAMVGYGFIAFLRWFFYQFRGVEGIGLGDAKMLALTGSLIGVSDIFLSIIVACIVAITLNLVRKKTTSKEIPFGPGIAISGVIFYYMKLFSS